MSKVVVYTANFAQRDNLKDPLQVVPGWRYMCFSDEPVSSNVWEVVQVHADLSPRLMARKIKLLPHLYLPKHSTSIWQDGNLRICADLTGMIAELGTSEVGMYPHRMGWNLFQILDNCDSHAWDWPKVFQQLRERYVEEEYPADHPTFETGVIIRRNTNLCRTFNEMWWDELSRYSIRDQASLSYVLWKLEIKACSLSGTVSTNPYFRFVPHEPSSPCYSDSRSGRYIKYL